LRFSELSDLRDKVAKTRSIKEKQRLLAEFLSKVPQDEVEVAVRFLLGRIFPVMSEERLDVSWKTVEDVIDTLKGEWRSSSLSINEVYSKLQEIGATKGKGSRIRKGEILKYLMERMDEKEQSFLCGCIFSELRQGVKEGVMRKALAISLDVDEGLIQRAEMFLGDLGKVAGIGVRGGREGIERIGMTLFVPIEPMLAEIGEDLGEVLTQHKGRTSLEYKFDGARVQIHKDGKRIRIFSRRLKEVTPSLPDVVKVAEGMKAESFIVEGEVVAISRDGRPLPFQQLMKRFRRIKEVALMVKEVPTHLYLFDILYLDNRSLVDLPYRERREILESIADEEYLSRRFTVSTPTQIDEVLKRAVSAGHEGVVAKDPDSIYTPGVRGRHWFKIKKAQTLDLAIIAAEWGHGRREGWLSNYWLAVKDKEDLKMVGKTFKGLSDEEFVQMTNTLLKIAKEERGSTVFVKPKVVVEVAFNEIQRSPHYESGFALRFARVLRIREDKGPDQIDTIQTLRRLYRMQFLHKGSM
jgi:DNA ligase-1